MMMVQLSRSQIGQKHVHSSDQNCFNCAELMVMWSTRKRKVVWRKGKEADHIMDQFSAMKQLPGLW